MMLSAQKASNMNKKKTSMELNLRFIHHINTYFSL